MLHSRRIGIEKEGKRLKWSWGRYEKKRKSIYDASIAGEGRHLLKQILVFTQRKSILPSHERRKSQPRKRECSLDDRQQTNSQSAVPGPGQVDGIKITTGSSLA